MSKRTNLSKNKNLEQYPYGQLLDYGGKIITMLSAVIGLAYAIGFVITNIHLLTEYGIYDFEIVKTRYILTGFFFLILSYMAYVAGMGVLKITELFQKTVVKIVIGILATIVFSSLIGFIIKGTISWSVQSYSKLATVATFIRIWGLLAILAVVAVVHFIREGGWQQYDINVPVPYSVFTSTLVIISAYSQLVYPVLPIALGGGTPVPIQMIIENEKAELINTAISFTDKVTTEKVYLIDQSSLSYFILVKSSDGIHGNAIEIRKDCVVGIIHLTKMPTPILTSDIANSTVTPTSGHSTQVPPFP